MSPLWAFFSLPLYCVLGAGSIFFRAIVNKKQCETRGLYMLLVIRYWIGDVQVYQDFSILLNVIFLVISLLNQLTKVLLLKARYSLIVLKVPLKPPSILKTIQKFSSFMPSNMSVVPVRWPKYHFGHCMQSFYLLFHIALFNDLKMCFGCLKFPALVVKQNVSFCHWFFLCKRTETFRKLILCPVLK